MREGRRSNVEMMVLFEYGHFPAHLRYIGRSFYELALNVIRTVPDSIERVLALRSILQARDGTISATTQLAMRQERGEVLRGLLAAVSRGPESEWKAG